ncbi:FtsK/SpoIIIE family DNA translocase [Oryzibacter oryziterrae]|uniref:FtsK/SpoIIIE family DNA translocase n=1 Tax=Oryzibacter oryziterrae TaxID=2766474 RepID=UPI0036F38682
MSRREPRMEAAPVPRPPNARRAANLQQLDRGYAPSGLAAQDRKLKHALMRNIAGASGLLLIGFVAALAAALATWSVDDPSWSHSTTGEIRNVLGTPGAVVSDLIMQLIGLNAAVFLAPVVIWGWQLMIGRIPRVARNRLIAWLGGTAFGAAFMSALPPTVNWPLPTGLGGAIGDLLLQIPAVFNGGVLTDTGRLVCLIIFGPLALAAMLYASGIPGRPIDAEPLPDMADEDDDEADSRFGALYGAFEHWWLTAKSSIGRRLGFGRLPAMAYPGEEIDDDMPEEPVMRRAAPAQQPRTVAAPRVSSMPTHQWADDEDEDDDLPLPPPVASRSRVEPSFAAAPQPTSRANAQTFAAPPPAPVYEAEEDEIEDDDPPPFDLDDRMADFDETEGFAAPIAPPRPVPVEPLQKVAPRPAPLRGPASRIGKAEAPPERASQRVQPPAPPVQQAKRSKAPTQLSLLDPDAFEFPAIELLAEPRNQGGTQYTPDSLEQNAGLLEGVLEDFGIKGEIFNVRPGPVVTLYELEPAPGIKSSRVIGLADDIARSMSAIAARVAVIPGKNAIGIELPNQRRETVYLRELIASQDFEKFKGRLALALGKTIGGEPVIIDLARTPHMLVAGTTGSGKSVSINTMILSLLYRMTPAECRLIMIDPKMLELSVYDGIPHLLSPVVTDPRKAVVALKWTVREMEDRYKKMSKVGVRNIEGFNARVAQAIEKGETINRTVQTGFDRETGEPIFETEEMELKPLPFIVVIIDEMADLMMVAGKEIEGAVQRLAQMARAAGIHVIMATQRPSVDVITGTIKANFPTRISFQVTSKIDSRTILGEQGAEQLLGQGDMLYMQGGGRIQRVHGPFVADGEVEAIVAHLKTQGVPDYLEAITADDEEDSGESSAPAASGGEEGGDLYDQAVALVLRDKRATTSYIQRRLGIGYNRAASLIERMEKEGLVGPPNHAGKREILIEREE